jgi:hypothetical protein
MSFSLLLLGVDDNILLKVNVSLKCIDFFGVVQINFPDKNVLDIKAECLMVVVLGPLCKVLPLLFELGHAPH